MNIVIVTGSVKRLQIFTIINQKLSFFNVLTSNYDFDSEARKLFLFFDYTVPNYTYF